MFYVDRVGGGGGGGEGAVKLIISNMKVKWNTIEVKEI